MNLRQKILALAIIPLLLAILAITALVTSQSTQLARASIATFERSLLKAKETELLNLTNMAVSAFADIYEAAGPDDEEAKAQVRAILSDLDYGPDGYFFAYDYDGVNIVHPRQAYRHGQNWLDLTDPDGNRVIYNLVERAKEGGGLHQYKWEKPSAGIIADKLSFAVGLDKWRWMLGTGVYLDDVFAQTAAAEADLRSHIDTTFIIVAAITVPIVIVVFLVSFLVTMRERRLADTRLKDLTQRVIDTQEEERARIARELHDGISQTMVAARYMLDLAASKVRNGAADAADVIDRGALGLNNAIKEVRRISHNLRPGMLDDLGLSAALDELTGNFSERTGIAVELKAVAFKNVVLPEARTALYRVAQEALTNIERHANASLVRITITSANGVHLVIEDDGVGFADAPPRKRQSGLGLRNMQERMEHFGGRLEVRTSSEGTVLRAWLPKSVYLIERKDPVPA
ncbi:MAG: cache domain-containing protein [Devosia sp.]|uniref:cache domain-containing protein n=1 Tax=Devosia sp. TaxID=1871048 RepID=UPI0024CA2EB9|nr:cache domain-containing protein [Devosia sp.]UYN98316.1 MAG: cache domain-containing protein [Devosia sp.]